MQLVEEKTGEILIESYHSGQITAQGCDWTGTVLITPQKIYHQGFPSAIGQLQPQDLQVLPSLEIALLLVATEGGLQLDPEILCYLINLGLGVETMNIGAACRTYNLLTMEHRQCGALFFLQ